MTVGHNVDAVAASLSQLPVVFSGHSAEEWDVFLLTREEIKRGGCGGEYA
jgi:hypothetical protein